MATRIDRTEKELRKEYHALAGQLGMDVEQRKAFLYDNYKVESSVDLDAHQLIDVVHTLEKNLGNETDTWRKRAIAAIGGWLRLQGIEKADPVENMRYIKQIACRSAQASAFNRIPMERLRNIYYTFLNKQKDKATIERVMNEEVLHQMQWLQAMSGGVMGEA